MFHIAKILEVMSPDEKGSKSSGHDTHALLEMWDENILLFAVAPQISKDVRANDIVLVDYSPVAVGGAPVPRHEISAILSEQKGKKMWAKMKEYLSKKRNPDGSDGEQTSREIHQGSERGSKKRQGISEKNGRIL